MGGKRTKLTCPSPTPTPSAIVDDHESVDDDDDVGRKLDRKT